jgi:hypothetical protein
MKKTKTKTKIMLPMKIHSSDNRELIQNWRICFRPDCHFSL